MAREKKPASPNKPRERFFQPRWVHFPGKPEKEIVINIRVSDLEHNENGELTMGKVTVVGNSPDGNLVLATLRAAMSQLQIASLMASVEELLDEHKQEGGSPEDG